MREPSTSLQLERWRQRLARWRTPAKWTALFTAGILAAFVALLFYNYLSPPPEPLTTKQVNDIAVEVLASATPPPAYSANVYQIILPSLVYIQTESPNADGEEGFGVGSGVVINTNGNILTSLHVVADATKINLIFADGSESEGVILTEQPENDIAVLQAFPPPELIVPAVIGSAGAMRVGDEAYVVGNPLGLPGSMSAGVISGFERSFTPEGSDQRLEGLIQIDAAVNPGNSGGPLLNRYGQVVGIVTALANPTDQSFFIGIGFAVPITAAGGAAGLPPY